MKLAALCIQCGESKPAPLAPCPSCHFTPATQEDRVASTLCSSVHQLQERLLQLQQDIRSGKKIEIPQQRGVAETRAAPPDPKKYDYDPELGRDLTSADVVGRHRKNALLFRVLMWTTIPFTLFAGIILLFGFFDAQNYHTGYNVPFYYNGVGLIYSLPFGRTLIEWAPFERAFHVPAYRWLPFLIAFALPLWLRYHARKQTRMAREAGAHVDSKRY